MTQNATEDSRIIIALDDMPETRATSLMMKLGSTVGGGKANDLLDECGAPVLNRLMPEHADLDDSDHSSDGEGRGFVHLRMGDPKIKDIPTTVANRVKRYHGRADLLTIHGSNSWKALKEAVKARDSVELSLIHI